MSPIEAYYFNAGRDLIIAGAFTLTLVYIAGGVLVGIIIAGIVSILLKVLRKNSEKEHMSIQGRGVGFKITPSALNLLIIFACGLLGGAYGGLKYIDVILYCFPIRFPIG